MINVRQKKAHRFNLLEVSTRHTGEKKTKCLWWLKDTIFVLVALEFAQNFLGPGKKILCNEEVKGLENEEPEGGLEF